MKIEIGKVVGVWGVKGWLKLHSYTRERNDISHYSSWFVRPSSIDSQAPWSEPIDVIECRQQGRGIVAKLAGVENREQAEALIGANIFVDRSQLPRLPQGEYYWQDLIGLSVSDLKDHLMGEVSKIIETGANDVLVVKPTVADDAQAVPEILIPYVKDVVVEIDLEAQTMRVDWDPSYLNE